MGKNQQKSYVCMYVCTFPLCIALPYFCVDACIPLCVVFLLSTTVYTTSFQKTKMKDSRMPTTAYVDYHHRARAGHVLALYLPCPERWIASCCACNLCALSVDPFAPPFGSRLLSGHCLPPPSWCALHRFFVIGMPLYRITVRAL